jgi:hypothetical protein
MIHRALATGLGDILDSERHDGADRGAFVPDNRMRKAAHGLKTVKR